MKKFMSKPTMVEAVQWTGTNYAEVNAMAGIKVDTVGPTGLMLTAGDEDTQSWVPVPISHWVVRNFDDETHYWSVDPDYFANEYEEMS